MNKKDKEKLLQEFESLYPDPQSELNFKNNYQLIASVLLSAQCTDKKVNEVTPRLFKTYPSFRALSEAALPEVEKIIRPVNYYKTKAKHLIGMARGIVHEYKGRVPRTHAELVRLPGVGQKTANVVQSERGIEPAFPVDTHVFRVAKRLGLAEAPTREKVEEELKVAFASEHWRNLHHWLIFHGRRVCKAQRPLCGECSVYSLCANPEEEE